MGDSALSWAVMPRWRGAIAAAALALRLATLATGAPPLSAEALTDEHVTKAIEALVEEFYQRKDPHRFWEYEKTPPGESTRQSGGYTALAVLALLHAGQSYQDPRLADAVEHLRTASLRGTYAVAVRCSLWARLPEKFHAQLEADARWLADGFNPRTGGWDYEQDPRSSRRDNSIRQFGALALWDAARRGVKIDPRLWHRLEEAFLDMQVEDGGWNYVGDGAATGSMTSAGLATLFITQDLLHSGDAVRLGRSAKPLKHEQAMHSALAWMDRNFSALENPGRGTDFQYYLWGVERIGLAGGYKTFGGQDWYRQGAAETIRRLCRWDEQSHSFAIHKKTAGESRGSTVRTDDLAFGLIFLSRGRVPVAVNKLQFSGAWNNRPRDSANLVNWIAQKSESALNWQIVSMEAPPESWLDAPLLYVASHEALPWMKRDDFDADGFVRQAREHARKGAAGALSADDAPPERPQIPELEKLKRYLDLGGLILAVNEGGGKAFAQSVEQAGTVLYPQFEWRTLPEDHWAYSLHAPVKARRPALRGLSNGARELIILAPSADLAQTFQAHDERLASHFETAANIYFLGSELNRPRPRLARHFTPPAAAPAIEDAVIIRAVHEGNCRPEPLALEVFAGWLAEARSLHVRVLDHPLSRIHELAPPPALVVVSGIDAHQFGDGQLAAMKAYVQAGGVILFETPGGRGAFTDSAEKAAGSIFAAEPQPLNDSRVITGESLRGAANLTRIDYRPFAAQTLGIRESMPRLRGMLIDGEPRILFSREDISHALLDQPCWGVSGYSPQSARDLLANIVQYVLSLADARAGRDASD